MMMLVGLHFRQLAITQTEQVEPRGVDWGTWSQ